MLHANPLARIAWGHLATAPPAMEDSICLVGVACPLALLATFKTHPAIPASFQPWETLSFSHAPSLSLSF